MCFLPCLSESISDLVSCSEPDKIAGLVGGKGCGLDSENFCDFMAMPLFQSSNDFGFRFEFRCPTRIDQHKNLRDLPAFELNVIY